MKDFIKSLFADKDGSMSSKRLVMFALVFTFILNCIVNLFWGKSMNIELIAALVPLIYYNSGLVASENVTDLLKKREPTKPAE